MEVKDVMFSMRYVEFVLFMLKEGDMLKDGEVELAHKFSKEILENYLVPKIKSLV